LAPLTYTYHTLSGLPGTQTGGRLDVGLPGTLLVPILKSIRKSVQELRDLLSSIELHLIGSSVLIIYEGDWERAEMGVRWLAEQPASSEEEGDVEEEEGSEESSEESSDEGSECPCVVKLIDFAHTRLKPGQGADVGVLKGLDNIVSLLDRRIAEVS
jgi:1D-myo-inositol-tetrakisphosphate 5-kinase/inositol-polyphosphate multikinase